MELQRSSAEAWRGGRNAGMEAYAFSSHGRKTAELQELADALAALDAWHEHNVAPSLRDSLAVAMGRVHAALAGLAADGVGKSGAGGGDDRAEALQRQLRRAAEQKQQAQPAAVSAASLWVQDTVTFTDVGEGLAASTSLEGLGAVCKTARNGWRTAVRTATPTEASPESHCPVD